MHSRYLRERTVRIQRDDNKTREGNVLLGIEFLESAPQRCADAIDLPRNGLRLGGGELVGGVGMHRHGDVIVTEGRNQQIEKVHVRDLRDDVTQVREEPHGLVVVQQIQIHSLLPQQKERLAISVPASPRDQS